MMAQVNMPRSPKQERELKAVMDRIKAERPRVDWTQTDPLIYLYRRALAEWRAQ